MRLCTRVPAILDGLLHGRSNIPRCCMNHNVHRNYSSTNFSMDYNSLSHEELVKRVTQLESELKAQSEKYDRSSK